MKLMDDDELRIIQDRKSAQQEKKVCKLAVEFARDNDLACCVEIGGLQVWVCDNSAIIPALEKHIEEIDKYLNNKPNMYQ
jgi:hypothetical protein